MKMYNEIWKAGKKMIFTVYGFDDYKKYEFTAKNGRDAIEKMLYFLNASNTDTNATIRLANGRTWELIHNGQTYACQA